MRRPLLLAATAALALAGCSSSSTVTSSPQAQTPSTLATSGDNGGGTVRVAGSITVAADPALTQPLGTLAKQFETLYPGTQVALSFGGGPDSLPANASTADVVLGTSSELMQLGSTAKSPQALATDPALIAVPKANPAKITGLGDLAKPKSKVALCAANTACGAFDSAVLSAARLTVHPAAQAKDAAGALGLVVAGKADATIVRGSDLGSTAKQVKTIGIAGSSAYEITALTGTHNSAVAQVWLQYVLGTGGRKVLAAAGLDLP